MAKDWAKAFYKSKRWQATRRSYISHRITIDGGLCEECIKETGQIVHHKQALTESTIKNASITCGRDNLMLVCKNCHDKYEGHGIGNKPSDIDFYFDGEGQPIPK